MPDGPTEIRRSPKDFTRLDAVDVLHGPLERDEMTTVVTHDAFRNTRRAGGVQNVKRIGCGHWNTISRLGVGQSVKPLNITPCDEFRRVLRTLEDDASLGLVFCRVDGFIEHRLIRDDAIYFNAARCRDNRFRTRVVYSTR